MYKVVIDKLATGLFLDTGASINKESAVGVLINSENIIELIEIIPISEFYQKTEEGPNKKISKSQAFELYSEIIKTQNDSIKIKSNEKIK